MAHKYKPIYYIAGLVRSCGCNIDSPGMFYGKINLHLKYPIIYSVEPDEDWKVIYSSKKSGVSRKGLPFDI